METINDVHLQFANYFHAREIAPYLYLLSQKMEEGSTCLDLSDIEKGVQENFPFDLKHYSIEKLLSNSIVDTTKAILDKPFVLDNGRLYFQRYYQYEANLIEKIKSIVENGEAQFSERIGQMSLLKNDFLRLFPKDSDKTDWQKIAAFFALLNDFTIITGGPGTGKTTTVSKILELCLLVNPDSTIALAAPTGKAAARMTESLRNAAKGLNVSVQEKFAQLKPATLHRLLGTIKDSLYFKHDKNNPLNYNIIVVDECSMIDIALFSKLLDAIGSHTKLILLGDKDQLSSVEVGSLFGDLCKTVTHLNNFSQEKVEAVATFFENEKGRVNTINDFLQNNIVELKESRRFDKNKGIGKLADAVLFNRQTQLESLLHDSAENQIQFDFDHSETVWKNFAKKYIDYIQETDIVKALHLLDQQRILCAVRDGEFGTRRLNQKIEDYLSSLNHLSRKDNFYENRPIMVTENNYELGLYNGDIGILRNDDGVMKAWFLDSDNKETGLKSVLPGLISNIDTVFAMTIHKSQGSEFNHVMIVLPDNNRSTQILTREILYTAITRAKEFVLVAASEQTIKETAERQVQRSSGVSSRL